MKCRPPPLSLKHREFDEFVLVVEDNGISIKDDIIVINQSTLELTLVTILTDQLHGKLTFEHHEEFKKFIIKF
ncbi:MAG: hypothetical protein U9N32_01485 [Spirochaetota bacterium]|nr:hypothetical protein [Spirochaetota bacterium]